MGIIAIYRIITPNDKFVYVKIKVAQGLWWAATVRPPVWYMNSMNKGDVAFDILGKPTAEIISKRNYRYYGSDQFDIYLTVKLKVGYNKRTKQYSFDRSPVSIGSPIRIQFPNEEVSGTVIDLDKKPFKEILIEKIIYLTKRGAFPWEADAIRVGDKYFDGENKIFEILEKGNIDTLSLTSDSYGNTTPNLLEPNKYITVKAKVLLKKVNNLWVFGEDQLVVPGRNLSISTPSFVFDNYLVSKIE